MAGPAASRRLSGRAFVRVSLVTVVAALLTVCAHVVPPRTAPVKPGEAAAQAKPQLDEWVIAFSEDISGLDPLTTTTGAIYYNVFYHVFDTLVGYEGRNFTPTPRLAESWKYVNENTLEMKLRKGVKFHNGDDFTADDVLYTYQGHKDNAKLGSGYVFDPVEKLEKVDAHTIRWITKGAVASLMPNIAQVLFIVPKSRARMGEEAFGKRPVGTGMYRLAADWRRDQPVRLTANETYWGGPGASPPRLQFKFIREPSTRVAELQNGTVHVAENIPLPQVELLKRGANTDVVAMKGARIIMHSFNLGKDPFTNVKVRQAINHAIGRDVIVKSLLQGYGQPHVGLFAPGWMGDGAKVEPYTLNVEKARRLLGEAGLPNGFEFEWQVTEGVFLKDREIAEAVAAQLKQAGITARLKITERATIFSNFFAGNYAVISTQWPTTADPDRYLQWLFIRTKAVNDAKEAEPVRQMMGEARRILDPAKRAQKYQEMSKLVYDSGMLMFVHVQDELYGIDKRTGWTPYPVRALATMHWYATHPTIKR
jgi:peptide/nickel transport system substrate-binding protein